MFQFHSFTHSCSVYPAPLIEEAIFAQLYILASFVKNKVPTGAWVYFWDFPASFSFDLNLRRALGETPSGDDLRLQVCARVPPMAVIPKEKH